MHELETLKEMIIETLEEYARRDTLTQNSLTMIDTLARTCKNVCKIIESCGGDSYESNRFVPKDSDKMARKLREMMAETTDDGLKAEIRRFAEKIESM